MSDERRDFIKQILAAGALPGLFASPGAFGALLDPQAAQDVNPDFDPKSFSFWSGFSTRTGEPAIISADRNRSRQAGDTQPVFIHHGEDGFRNAALLDAGGLIETGDVIVSVNTSAVKIGQDDLSTFEKVQNAQLRIDLHQKTGVIPMIEAMAYTIVGAMRSVQATLPAKTAASSAGSKTTASAAKKTTPTIQNLTIASDTVWQKMQNVPLPQGEGLWSLNLEAQKKDSVFCKVLQAVLKEGGLFAPMFGFPGIVMSALDSFNNVYGALHAEPVQIIQSDPVPVFATQDALQKKGGPGTSGVLLQPGTYILMPAAQAPNDDEFKKYTLVQDRIVPVEAAKLTQPELDAVAGSTLEKTTYVTFSVGVAHSNPFVSGGGTAG